MSGKRQPQSAQKLALGFTNELKLSAHVKECVLRLSLTPDEEVGLFVFVVTPGVFFVDEEDESSTVLRRFIFLCCTPFSIFRFSLETFSFFSPA